MYNMRVYSGKLVVVSRVLIYPIWPSRYPGACVYYNNTTNGVFARPTVAVDIKMDVASDCRYTHVSTLYTVVCAPTGRNIYFKTVNRIVSLLLLFHPRHVHLRAEHRDVHKRSRRVLSGNIRRPSEIKIRNNMVTVTKSDTTFGRRRRGGNGFQSSP